MGVPYSGGTVVTKGGLIFMGGTMDRHMRALDIETGEELWSDVLPNNAQATPMSYVSPPSRRQYVVITVPGKSRPRKRAPDAAGSAGRRQGTRLESTVRREAAAGSSPTHCQAEATSG